MKKGDFERETGNAGLSKRNNNNAIETRQEVVRIYLPRIGIGIGIWRHLPWLRGTVTYLPEKLLEKLPSTINVQYINMRKIINIGFRWPEKRIPTMGVPH